MAIDSDLRHFPLVYTRFDGIQTSAELESYIARMAPVHARKEPWVSVVIINNYIRDLWFLRRMARWIKETDDVVRHYCVACAMVTSSSGLSFMLSTVFLMQPLRCPYLVCRNLDEANAFVRAQAAKRGLSLPEGKPTWADKVAETRA
jgi:hypothetical protein